ncbi:hypothetical protein SAMN05444277_10467 [Parafilimonas terrae]|uniref:Uncharacterized protein n=1 Tax=Parafilimonas terrae TaxID=1465490 RepID=A0A1I5UXD2_9BACT|nr:hypothetical protein SAMN05444277_10467 [Parafilimonas terrae]
MKFFLSLLLFFITKNIKCQPKEIIKNGFVLIINDSYFFLENDSSNESMDSLIFDTTKEFINLIPSNNNEMENVVSHSLSFKRNLYMCGNYSPYNKMKYARVSLTTVKNKITHNKSEVGPECFYDFDTPVTPYYFKYRPRIIIANTISLVK